MNRFVLSLLLGVSFLSQPLYAMEPEEFSTIKHPSLIQTPDDFPFEEVSSSSLTPENIRSYGNLGIIVNKDYFARDMALLNSFSPLENVTSLNLIANPIEGDSLAFLPSCPNLKKLFIGQTDMSGLNGIERFPQLEHLAFVKTHVNDLTSLREKGLPKKELVMNASILPIGGNNLKGEENLKTLMGFNHNLKITFANFDAPLEEKDEIKINNIIEGFKKDKPNLTINYYKPMTIQCK